MRNIIFDKLWSEEVSTPQLFLEQCIFSDARNHLVYVILVFFLSRELRELLSHVSSILLETFVKPEDTWFQSDLIH